MFSDKDLAKPASEFFTKTQWQRLTTFFEQHGGPIEDIFKKTTTASGVMVLFIVINGLSKDIRDILIKSHHVFRKNPLLPRSFDNIVFKKYRKLCTQGEYVLKCKYCDFISYMSYTLEHMALVHDRHFGFGLKISFKERTTSIDVPTSQTKTTNTDTNMGSRWVQSANCIFQCPTSKSRHSFKDHFTSLVDSRFKELDVLFNNPKLPLVECYENYLSFLEKNNGKLFTIDTCLHLKQLENGVFCSCIKSSLMFYQKFHIEIYELLNSVNLTSWREGRFEAIGFLRPQKLENPKGDDVVASKRTRYQKTRKHTRKSNIFHEFKDRIVKIYFDFFEEKTYDIAVVNEAIPTVLDIIDDEELNTKQTKRSSTDTQDQAVMLLPGTAAAIEPDTALGPIAEITNKVCSASARPSSMTVQSQPQFTWSTLRSSCSDQVNTSGPMAALGNAWAVPLRPIYYIFVSEENQTDTQSTSTQIKNHNSSSDTVCTPPNNTNQTNGYNTPSSAIPKRISSRRTFNCNNEETPAAKRKCINNHFSNQSEPGLSRTTATPLNSTDTRSETLLTTVTRAVSEQPEAHANYSPTCSPGGSRVSESLHESDTQAPECNDTISEIIIEISDDDDIDDDIDDADVDVLKSNIHMPPPPPPQQYRSKSIAADPNRSHTRCSGPLPPVTPDPACSTSDNLLDCSRQASREYNSSTRCSTESGLKADCDERTSQQYPVSGCTSPVAANNLDDSIAEELAYILKWESEPEPTLPLDIAKNFEKHVLGDHLTCSPLQEYSAFKQLLDSLSLMTKCETENHVLENRMKSLVKTYMGFDDSLTDEKNLCRGDADDTNSDANANFDDITKDVENMMVAENKIDKSSGSPYNNVGGVAAGPPELEDEVTFSADDDTMDFENPSSGATNEITTTIPTASNSKIESPTNHSLVNETDENTDTFETGTDILPEQSQPPPTPPPFSAQPLVSREKSSRYKLINHVENMTVAANEIDMQPYGLTETDENTDTFKTATDILPEQSQPLSTPAPLPAQPLVSRDTSINSNLDSLTNHDLVNETDENTATFETGTDILPEQSQPPPTPAPLQAQPLVSRDMAINSNLDSPTNHDLDNETDENTDTFETGTDILPEQSQPPPTLAPLPAQPLLSSEESTPYKLISHVENMTVAANDINMQPYRTSSCTPNERKEALKMFLLSLIPEVEPFNDEQIKLFKRQMFKVIDDISSQSTISTPRANLSNLGAPGESNIWRPFF